MSFAEYETSADQGSPITLFEFRFGPTDADVIGYTDAENDITFEGRVYAAVPIDCGEITASGTLDKAKLSITFFEGAGITDLFRLRPTSTVVTVAVRQGHANDPDAQFLVNWTGRVTGFSIDAEQNSTTLTGEPIGTSMGRNGLRRHYQYGCPHVLYGDRCKANKAAASATFPVISISGSTLLFAAGWVPDSRKPKYLGGYLQYTQADGRVELRTIIRVENDGHVLVAAPPYGLVAGATVTMVLGCNHKSGVGPQPTGDCLPVHHNILNFGGQMFIPFKNPIGIVNNYY